MSMKSTEGRRPGYSLDQCSWTRGNNSNWNNTYVGDCGVSPTYINLPTNVSQISQQQSTQSNITEFDNWRKKWMGSQVEQPVSSSKPYGSVVANWDECKNVINNNSSVKQVVYNKTSKTCWPMSEMSSEDQDGKGGSNTDWISAQRNTNNTNSSKQSTQSNISVFDNWRKKWMGSQVEQPVSSSKPYGSVKLG